MKRLASIAAVTGIAVTAALLSGGAARASVTPFLPGTATTTLTDRPDNGGGGTWATDDLTRTLVIRQTGPGTYVALVTDQGQFRTIIQALTPNQGVPDAGLKIRTVVTGNVTGWAEYSFTASEQPGLSLVPAMEYGPGGGPTSLWYQLAFPAGTVFGGAGIGHWNWTYVTGCQVRLGHRVISLGRTEAWVDAWDNGDGQLPADGNITGAAGRCFLPFYRFTVR